MPQTSKTIIKDGFALGTKNINDIFERGIESGSLKNPDMPHKKIRNKTVAVVGLGYVGLPLAILVVQNGYYVIGVDVDDNKIDLLRKKIPTFVDKKVAEDLLSVKLPVISNPTF
jgi:lactate dehydrogenase-like 2-hydroxyacid dehydrogenase